MITNLEPSAYSSLKNVPPNGVAQSVRICLAQRAQHSAKPSTVFHSKANASDAFLPSSRTSPATSRQRCTKRPQQNAPPPSRRPKSMGGTPEGAVPLARLQPMLIQVEGYYPMVGTTFEVF